MFKRKHICASTLIMLIFCIALLCRFLVIQSIGTKPQSDALVYHQIALNQLAGYGHAIKPGKPTTMRPPLYPLFLAGIYALTGTDYRHALYAQSILQSLLVFPLFLLGFRISGRIKVGILAAGFFAVHTSFEIVSRLYRENLTVFLVVLFIWSTYESFRKPTFVKFVVTGLLSGLLGLTNPVFIPLSIMLFLVGLLWPKTRNFSRLLFVQSIISIMLISPWMIRNQMISDNGQANLNRHVILYGYYPAFADKWWWPVMDMVALEKEREKASCFFASQTHGRNLISELRLKILSHPIAAIKLAISRILILWVSPPVGTSQLKSYSSSLALIALGFQYYFVLTSLIILGYKLPRHPELLVFALLAVFLTCVYAAIHSIRRYGYPLVPQTCLFFAWGVFEFFRIKVRKDH